MLSPVRPPDICIDVGPAGSDSGDCHHRGRHRMTLADTTESLLRAYGPCRSKGVIHSRSILSDLKPEVQNHSVSRATLPPNVLAREESFTAFSGFWWLQPPTPIIQDDLEIINNAKNPFPK